MISYNNISAYTNVYLGSQQMSKVYVGTHQVFPTSTPTGSKVYLTYSNKQPKNVECNGDSVLRSNDVSGGHLIDNIRTATIGSCVTELEGDVFYRGYGLSAVTIPNTVTSIGNNAFGYCYSLSSITIPSSVTSIGSEAFQICSGLTSITIPSSVTSIGGSAFERCISLTGVTIPNSVTSIGGSTFKNCSGLTSVTIGSGVTSIGEEAFRNCYSLPSIEIPNSVTSIGKGAFDTCSGLTSCTIGSGVTSIGVGAFQSCTSLTSVNIPSGVTSIDIGTFRYCTSLSNVTMPSGVTRIYSDAFRGCTSLTSIDIPSGVTSIGESAFQDCSSLTSVTIPSGVTYISGNAFKGCSGLTSITSLATTPPYLYDSGTFDDTNNCPIYVPCESVEDYKTAWSAYESRIQCIPTPSFTGKVYSEFFGGDTYSADCDSNTTISLGDILNHKAQNLITKCVVGDCVTEIQAATFNSLYNISSITISDNVTTIGGSGQFGSCNNLKRVNSDVDGVMNIPSGVANIASTFIQACPLITAITIHDGVTTIGDNVITTMTGLKTVTIGSGVTSIGRQCIYSCTGLTSITINATTPPSIGSYVFYNTNNCPIYVPASALSAYQSASGWSNFTSRLQAIP